MLRIFRWGLLIILFCSWTGSGHARFYETFLAATPHQSMKELLDYFLAHTREFARPPADTLAPGQIVLERAQNKPHALIDVDEFKKALAAFVDQRQQALNNAPLWLNRVVPDACQPRVQTGEEAELDDLEKATRILRDSHLMDDFVQKYEVINRQQGRFIGDLHGSLHALIRVLSSWYIAHVIGDDFRLRNPNDIIVFTGDFIDRGHYGIEVLYVVFRLILANPERVFLIKGNHEDQKIKKTKGFGLELVTNYGDAEATPFVDNYLKKVFSYFPCALFLGCGVEGQCFFAQCCHGGIALGYNPDRFLATAGVSFEKLVFDEHYREEQKAALVNAADFDHVSMAVKDGFISSLFYQKHAVPGKMVWDVDEESFAADMQTVDTYLSSHPPIKFFIRGHQDKDFGLKMFFKSAQWDTLTGDRQTQLGQGPFNWREVVSADDQAEELGFRMLDHAPVFTITSAAEGKSVHFDGDCLVTFSLTLADWRLKYHETPLSPARHGKYISIDHKPVMHIKTYSDEPPMVHQHRPLTPALGRRALQEAD